MSWGARTHTRCLPINKYDGRSVGPDEKADPGIKSVERK